MDSPEELQHASEDKLGEGSHTPLTRATLDRNQCVIDIHKDYRF